MKQFKEHYKKVEEEAKTKLNNFSDVNLKNDKALFEELTFCIFAANSSAKMGLKAVNLLRPVLHTGSLNDYLDAVKGKVRFHTIRSKYLFRNKTFIDKKGGLSNILARYNDADALRMYLRKNIVGFGMKESSHFLRNIGFKSFCILDKHVIRTLASFKVLDSDQSPKTDNAYLKKESVIKTFAANQNLCVDVLDLALWSYNTGEIIK